MHDAFGAAGDRALHCRTQFIPRRAVAAGEYAQQHRQRSTRDAFDAPVLEQTRDHVTRRGTEDVGEHQHSVACIKRLEQLARAQHEVVGVVLPPDAQRRHLRGRLAEDLRGAREQRFANGPMGDDQDADHSSLSSASRNMPATSKPVWSWISLKPVGLVTLTSVRKSPITSSPTNSKPLAASTGPNASPISRWRALSGCATP